MHVWQRIQGQVDERLTKIYVYTVSIHTEGIGTNWKENILCFFFSFSLFRILDKRIDAIALPTEKVILKLLYKHAMKMKVS